MDRGLLIYRCLLSGRVLGACYSGVLLGLVKRVRRSSNQLIQVIESRDFFNEMKVDFVCEHAQKRIDTGSLREATTSVALLIFLFLFCLPVYVCLSVCLSVLCMSICLSLCVYLCCISVV